MVTKGTYWSCFSEIQDVDNRPYIDVLGIKYSFDWTVPNNKRIKTGDVLVIRDNRLILGFGRVTEMVSKQGSKIMLLCVKCRRSGPIARTTKKPTYRCTHCGSEFDKPEEEERSGTVYEAWYAGAWYPFPQPVPIEALSTFYLGKDQQNAIRELRSPAAEDFLKHHSNVDGFTDLHEVQHEVLAGGHVETIAKRRIGQQEFRRRLLQRFGGVCAVTGSQPEGILDAAHLYRFADRPIHEPDGGLLLRADIHRLFDSFQLAIDPSSWTVRLAPSLEYHEGLQALSGQPVFVAPHLRPRAELVGSHLQECSRRWQA